MSTGSSLLDIETTAQQLAQRVIESLPVTIASVALWDGPSLSLTVKAIGTARPLGVPLPLWSRVSLATAPAHRAALQHPEPVFLDLEAAGQAEVRDEVARVLVPDLRAVYLLPIRLGDETVGLLGLGEMRSTAREPMSFEKRERCRAILDEFLANSAHAWEAGRLRQQIRAMASLLRMVRGTFDARTVEDVLATCASEAAGWLGVPVRALLFRVAPSGDIRVAALYRISEPMTSTDAGQILLALNRSRTRLAWPVMVTGVAEDPLDPLNGTAPDAAHWTRITLPLMDDGRLAGLICLYVEDEIMLSDWELEAFRHRAEIASRALTLVSALEDQTHEQAWVGRAAYEALSASQPAALREALKGIDRLVATFLPGRVQRLASELQKPEGARQAELGGLAEAVTREVAAVLDGLRGEDSADTARWEVDLNALVRRVTSMARASLEMPFKNPDRGSIQLRLELSSVPLVARTSPELVAVLVHVIENAVEAMPSGGEIRVRTARDNGHAVISVQDNGPGVAALEWDVFAPLVSTKGKPHLGLGLSVVRSVVNAHGGSVSLVSRKGGGALLQIRLPLVGRSMGSNGCDETAHDPIDP
jgi:signal transduction histidine kinase